MVTLVYSRNLVLSLSHRLARRETSKVGQGPIELKGMPQKINIPSNMEPIQQAALRALGPVKPADSNTRADKNFLLVAKRTDAGRQLPPYYLVYFLLVDLLGFENLGQFEKVSWSVPIDFQGQAFLIEHRKFGVGVFAHDPKNEEAQASEIVARTQKAVKSARPFFDWLADQAVAASAVNVVNNSSALFARFTYLRDAYRSKSDEAKLRKDEVNIEKHESATSGHKWETVSFPALQLNRQADWLAMAAIDAFFSWTEHVFIHLAILLGTLNSAQQVAELAEANWTAKFKAALNLTDVAVKSSFDALIAMRRELRNYVAHGAFGKQGEAFTFHSSVGAVPVLLPHRTGSKKFTLGHGLDFDSETALQEIARFIALLWSGRRSPAQKYIQESHLPIILTMAADGTYADAMRSDKSMSEFVEHLSYRFDEAANMDW